MGPARTSVFVLVAPLGRANPLVTVTARVPFVTLSVRVNAALSGSPTRMALFTVFVAEKRSAALEKTVCEPGTALVGRA